VVALVLSRISADSQGDHVPKSKASGREALAVSGDPRRTPLLRLVSASTGADAVAEIMRVWSS